MIITLTWILFICVAVLAYSLFAYIYIRSPSLRYEVILATVSYAILVLLNVLTRLNCI